jgi:hypothetical protein
LGQFVYKYLLVLGLVVFFIATITALCAENIKGYQPSYRFTANQKSVNVFGETEVNSLFYILIFHSVMPKTMKSESRSKNSTLTLPSAHETGIKAFNIDKNAELSTLSLSDYPKEIQSILLFLVENKMPVMLVFNITNNNMKVGDSRASNICLVAGKDNNSTAGHGNLIKKENEI